MAVYTVGEKEGVSSEYVVQMRGIVKTFPGVVALNGVDFDLKAGEIHALLGENGAGKTTLMNILYGLYKPDRGEIYIRGRKVNIRSPKDAIEHKIGMVHQHFSLIDSLTVTENIILAIERGNKLFVNKKKIKQQITEFMKSYGLFVDVDKRIADLSMGERQRVEILRTLLTGAEILILDEPTTVLTPQETRELFRVLKRMVQDGRSVVFISHKLKEVLEISHRITVLRRGNVVGTIPTSEADENILARMMVGQEIVTPKVNTSKPGEVVLKLDRINVWVDKRHVIKDFSLEIRSGEIFGIVGVAGNGQKELVEAITGLRKISSGKVLINGSDATNSPTWRIISYGVAYIPEDRMRVAILPDLSVAENLVLKRFEKPPFSKRGILNYGEIFKFADRMISEYNIRTPSRETKAQTLSGGNIQRLILARELSSKPALIIASQPTKGLDIAATNYVRSKLLEYRDMGCAVLLITEDLDEALEISDRIGVIYEGRLMGILERSEFDREKIGLMMGGVRPEEVKAG